MLVAAVALSACAAPAQRKAARISVANGKVSKPIGVEPVAGVFRSVVPAGHEVDTPKSMRFSLGDRRQADALLAIYVTDRSRIRNQQTPAARYVIRGITPGRSREARANRVEVTFTPRASGTLELAARDAGTGRELIIEKATPAEVQRLSAAPGLEPIAERVHPPTRKEPGIGIRTAGGVYTELIPANAKAGVYGKRIFATSPDQFHGVLTLYSSNRPFIEDARPFARYIVFGFPPESSRRQMEVTFGVDEGGSLDLTARDPETDRPLQVQQFRGGEGRLNYEPLRKEAPKPAPAGTRLPAAQPSM